MTYIAVHTDCCIWDYFESWLEKRGKTSVRCLYSGEYCIFCVPDGPLVNLNDYHWNTNSFILNESFNGLPVTVVKKDGAPTDTAVVAEIYSAIASDSAIIHSSTLSGVAAATANTFMGDERIADLERQVAGLKEVIDSKEKEIEELNTKLEAKDNDIANLNYTISDMGFIIKAKDKELASLKDELKQAITDLTDESDRDTDMLMFDKKGVLYRI